MNDTSHARPPLNASDFLIVRNPLHPGDELLLCKRCGAFTELEARIAAPALRGTHACGPRESAWTASRCL